MLQPKDGEEGLTAAEIADAARGMGMGKNAASRNSFNASVYVTLVRLSQRGQLRVIRTEKGRRFIKADASGVLFKSAQEAHTTTP